jgi:hypothetical protein
MAHELKFRKARILMVEKQSAKTKVKKPKEAHRSALKTRLRISKYGNIYIETRLNKKDINPTKKRKK